MSGPLLDRIDIRVHVPRVTAAVLRSAAGTTPTTAEARRVVAAARSRMAVRLAGSGWTRNAEVTGAWLRGPGHAEPGATTVLDRGLELGTVTMRGWDRVMRLAWTIADLDDVDRPDGSHVAAALALRSGL